MDEGKYYVSISSSVPYGCVLLLYLWWKRKTKVMLCPFFKYISKVVIWGKFYKTTFYVHGPLSMQTFLGA